MTKDGGLVRSIQTLYEAGSLGGLEDAELLGMFLGRGEASEAAFEAIVARHEAMVLGVCRAAAGSEAEDAFQATFLVLACRAAKVRNRASLGPWLFGVARRLATRARRNAARRRVVEARAAGQRPTIGTPDEPDDAIAALVEEVGRLPARYRDPVVLCHLQGMTYEAAARRLGCPLGTLSVRIRRAKERLRTTLERRGVCEASALAAFPGAAAPKTLAASTARLASLVAPALVKTGVPASVLSLTQGALKIMRIQRLAVMSAVFLALAAGAWAWRAAASMDEPKQIPAAAKATRYQATGEVFDEEGRPGEGAVISVLTHYPENGRLVVRKARTGADGRFTLDLPPGHSEDLSLVPPPGCWDPRTPVPLAPFSLSAEAPTLYRSFFVMRGGGWTFSYTQGGRPIPKASVGGKATTETSVSLAYAQCDEAGRAVLGLPRRKGEAEVRASGVGLAERPLQCRLRWDDQFRPDSVRSVTRLDGEPIRYWVTDRNGRSALVESAPGDRFEPTIENGRLVILADLPEAPRDTLPEVAGTVVDAGGKPIVGARVGVIYGLGQTYAEGEGDDCVATTDESGRFRLSKIPSVYLGGRPKTLQLAVTRDGFAAVDTPSISVAGNAPPIVPPIVLAPGCSASGVVLRPNGKPAEGAQVEPAGTFSARFRRTWTDAQGRFTVTGLPEGKIGLEVRYGELSGEPSLVQASRDPQPVEIRLRKRW